VILFLHCFAQSSYPRAHLPSNNSANTATATAAAASALAQAESCNVAWQRLCMQIDSADVLLSAVEALRGPYASANAAGTALNTISSASHHNNSSSNSNNSSGGGSGRRAGRSAQQLPEVVTAEAGASLMTHMTAVASGERDRLHLAVSLTANFEL